MAISRTSIILFIFFHSLASAAWQSEIKDEDYLVYSAVLNKIYAKYGNKIVIIKGKTSTDFVNIAGLRDKDINYDNNRDLSPATEETIRNLVNKNREQYTLASKFISNARYKLATDREIAECFRKGSTGWNDFYYKYPESMGFITFSRVGLNREENQAVLFVSIRCGGLCGIGNYIILTKDGGEWKIQKEITVWIS